MNTNKDIDFSKIQIFSSTNFTLPSQNKLTPEFIASYNTGNIENVTQNLQKLNLNENTQQNHQHGNYYQYGNQYYDPFNDTQSPFNTTFPRAQNYSNIKAIAETFPHLEKVNDPNFDLSSISQNAQFYIMRSSNDDNIHKAIKYHIWSSTPNGKALLRKIWQDFQESQLEPEVYLIFTVVGSNQFVGVAKMTSNVKDDESFKYWWEPCKWFGTFQLQWVFIKDIHHSKFEHIRQDNSSVINLKDSTPIDSDTGKQILQIFKNHQSRPNIFEYFNYMDRREDYIRNQRDNDNDFKKYFEECCEAYQKDPNIVFAYKRPQNQKKNYRNNGYNNYNNTTNSNSNSNTGNFFNSFNPMNANGSSPHRKNNNHFFNQKSNPYYKQPDEPVISFFDQITIKTTDHDKSNKKTKLKKQKKPDAQLDFLEAGKLNFNPMDFPHIEENDDYHKQN